MMQRLVLLALVVVLLAAGLGGFYLAQPSQRELELTRELNKLQTENLRLRADNEKLLAAKKPDPHFAPTAGLSPAAVKEANKASASAAESTRHMLDDPVRREAMFKYQEQAVEREYGQLFKQLGLSDKELDYFKHLLSEKRAKQTDITIKLGVGTTPEQKEAIRQQQAAIKSESDAAIQQFLNNDEDYKVYQHWEDSFLERLQIQMAVTHFDSAGETLSGEQRDQLFDLMIASRITSDQRSDLKAGAKTQADMTEQFQKLRQANDQNLLQQSASFLSPKQLEILEKMQQRRLSLSAASTPKPGPASSAP